MGRAAANVMVVLVLIVLVLGILSLSKGLTADSSSPPQNGYGQSATNPPISQPSGSDQGRTNAASFSSGGAGAAKTPRGARGQSGQNRTVSVALALNQGDGMIGQSFGFLDATGGCQVFAVIGPYTGSVTVTDGEWWIYGDGDLTQPWVNAFIATLQEKQRQSYSCPSSNVTMIP